ncbi:MAG: prepilin-type N-terminal cleavage/methylation domain-containing protein [Cyanobacteria bacterium SIG32]|nr:prepilin-type N-terminal cleavage/methylation domain-containing protein [Cyanobacteria bacterium SIG32]
MKNPVKNLITWSPSHLITSQKSAFTLAEVLITLAIIGVVAAMTIPTLVANYQTRAWNTSATVFDRKLTEALKVMNTQGTLAGLKTTENFVEELSKHLKITKTCTNDKLMDCFSEEVFWGAGTATPEAVDMTKIKTAKNFGQNDWGTNIVGIQLANGTNALVAYNPTNTCNQDPYSNQITGEKCLAILYDTSGSKSPNTSSKDLRSNSNVTKLGSACAIEVNGKCFSAPFFPEPMSYADCAGENATSAYTTTTAGSYAQSLGIAQCYYENDKWAGAVEACGGTGNMPDEDDLTAIAQLLYPSITVSSTATTTYCAKDENNSYTKCRETELALSLGFKNESGTLTDSQGFYVWSGVENGNYDAYGRYFGPIYTGRGNYGGRSASCLMAVCLAK